MRLAVKIDLVKSVSAVTQTSSAAYGANVAKQPNNSDGVGFRGYHLANTAGQWPSINDGSYKLYGTSGYPGWISKTLSDASGNIDITWTLTFSDETEVVVVSFDRVCNEYATLAEVTVDGQTYQVTNNAWRMFVRLEGASSCTIRLLKWNKPFKNVKITSFSTNITETFEGSAIQSITYSEQVWNSQFEISTGFVEQYADIDFRDVRGILRAAADADLLMDNLQVRIYTIDETGTEKHAGTYISDTWSVSGEDDTVELACNDESRNFQKYTLDVVGQNMSVTQVLRAVFDAVPNTSFTIPSSIAEYLDSCICADVYFQAVDAQTILDEVCDRWMLRLYWDAQEATFKVMEAW